MAKVLLEPLGDPRERFLPDDAWRTQKARMAALTADLEAKRATVRAGWRTIVPMGSY